VVNHIVTYVCALYAVYMYCAVYMYYVVYMYSRNVHIYLYNNQIQVKIKPGIFHIQNFLKLFLLSEPMDRYLMS